MYWIVGCPPGGSAGTSFCSGTEISISRLAICASSRGSVYSSDVSSLRRPGARPCFSKLRFFRRQVRLQSDRLDAGLDNDITPLRHLVLDTLLDGLAYL